MARGIGVRLRERGAAMVEAGVLAPIFTMFWLLMMQLSGMYQYKILCNQETRYQAFYMAVNDCNTMGLQPDPTQSGNANTITSGVGQLPMNTDMPTDGEPGNTGKATLPAKPPGWPNLSFIANTWCEADYDYRPPDHTKGDKEEINNATSGANGGVFKLLPTHVTSKSKVVCAPGSPSPPSNGEESHSAPPSL